MPGPYRRIDHPNPNSFVVSAESAAIKAKPVKKAAEPVAPVPVVEPVKADEKPAKSESKADKD